MGVLLRHLVLVPHVVANFLFLIRWRTDQPHEGSTVSHMLVVRATWCYLLFATGLGASNLSAQSRALDRATSIVQTVRKLAAVELPDEDLHYNVPAAARPLLTQLKHGLRDLVLSEINDPASRGLNSTQFTQAVLQELKTVGVEVGGRGQPQYFGAISNLEIVQPSKHPELRAVTTTVSIPCGDDTSLYVLKQSGTEWTAVIAIESNDYGQVNGAYGDFGFGISEPDESSNWFLVTKYVPPWCTSRWATIRYRVLRPGRAPAAPEVLLNREDSTIRNEPDTLTVAKHGFTLVNVDGQSLDARILERLSVHRYLVSGNRVIRVPPIAIIPQDFVDEWIDLPQNEARRWSNASAMDRIQSWHSRLQRRAGKDLESWYYYSEIEFVQPCNEPPSKWEIGISIDSRKRQDKLPAELFFAVSEKNGDFEMTDITEKRTPGCVGDASPVEGLDWKLLQKVLKE